jgi:hypothetical protein
MLSEKKVITQRLFMKLSEGGSDRFSFTYYPTVVVGERYCSISSISSKN